LRRFLSIALASAALCTGAAAHAAPALVVSGGSLLNPSNNDFGWISGPVRAGGTLGLSEAGTVTVEYIGKEAGFANTLFRWGALDGGATAFTTGSAGGAIGQTAALPTPPSAIGAALSFAANAGDLLFNFLVAATGATVGNGDDPANGDGIAFWSAAANVVYLLLDDGGGAGDADYDDMVVRLTVASPPTVLVETPEPGTLVLILAGVGMIALIARRRLRQ
jgi:hypothetical protein